MPAESRVRAIAAAHTVDDFSKCVEYKNARRSLAGRFALLVEVAGVEPASEGA
jgi:hypothetical protein